MEFMFRSKVIAEVPKRWAEQYKNTQYGHQAEKTAKLEALAPGFTAKDVNDIIGNTSWTELKCDECGTDSEALIGLGKDYEYNGSKAYVCKRCMQVSCAALDAIFNTLPK